MRNTFYLVKHREDCWNLRVKDIHFTMSAKSSKEEILECLYKIVLKYRTKKHLLSVISKMEYSTPLSKEQMQERVNQEQISLEYAEDVYEVVAKALKEVAMDNDVVRARKRIKVLPDLVQVKEEGSEAVVKEPVEVTPKKLLKRIKVHKVALPVDEEE